MSRNRWAAQERVDLMMMDLERQSKWAKTKEEMKAQWEDAQQQNEKGSRQSKPIQTGEQTTEAQPPVVADMEAAQRIRSPKIPDVLDQKPAFVRAPFVFSSKTLIRG